MKRVTPAIAKGIAGNKDTMIDALYPIMGGMISKYVTQAIKEMMESINKKIEQGLSFERVKRKAKAKLTGLSESELLLEESADARISSLFVIHKETSLLIADAHMENKEIDDAHMVASMASAIKDFINDWIQHSDTNNEVQLLSYGNATLYIESAGSVFLIAFLDTEPDQEQRIEINTFFASIVKEYASFFQEFEGDDSADEIAKLSKEMKNYLYSQEFIEKKKKKNPAKYIFIVLGLLFFAYLVYSFNTWYIKSNLEGKILTQTGEHISLHTEGKHLVLKGQVRSLSVAEEIEKTLRQDSDMPILNHLSVPMGYLDKRFKNEKNSSTTSLFGLEHKLLSLEQNHEKSLSEIRKNIMYLKKELNALNKYHRVLKEVIKIKDEIHNKLDKAFVDNKFYNANEHALDFRSLALFSPGKILYNAESIQVVAKTFTKYLTIVVQYRAYLGSIKIKSYTDSSGREENNLVLAKKRALNVKYHLEELDIVKQYHMQTYIQAEGFGSTETIIINNQEDKNASRRIIITFFLDDKKILNKLGNIIND